MCEQLADGDLARMRRIRQVRRDRSVEREFPGFAELKDRGGGKFLRYGTNFVLRVHITRLIDDRRVTLRTNTLAFGTWAVVRSCCTSASNVRCPCARAGRADASMKSAARAHRKYGTMNLRTKRRDVSQSEAAMTSMEASAWAAARGEKWKAGLAGMEATLRPVDEPLIRALQLNAPYRIADLACGGGGTTFEVVRNAPAGSVVHGFDISSALVEVARSRQIGGERTAFECINLQSAPPPHGPYDRLVSRFGVMFFDDPETAFTNLR